MPDSAALMLPPRTIAHFLRCLGDKPFCLHAGCIDGGRLRGVLGNALPVVYVTAVPGALHIFIAHMFAAGQVGVHLFQLPTVPTVPRHPGEPPMSHEQIPALQRAIKFADIGILRPRVLIHH